MVQEAWLRWEANRTPVSNPKAYLAKTVTRLCLDYLKTARVQREQYVGPWLPEPIVADDGGEAMLALSDSLSFAFLMMLETLTPIERAVLLLRDVFEYGYDEIAEMVGKSSANCRQILRRAKGRVADRQPRFDTSPETRDRILMRFMQTCATGDMDGLVAILDEDIVMWSDGGGKMSAALKPIRGNDKVVRFLFGLLKRASDSFDHRLALLNNQPAIVTLVEGVVETVMLFHVEDEQLRYIYAVRNPDKLARIAALFA